MKDMFTKYPTTALPNLTDAQTKAEKQLVRTFTHSQTSYPCAKTVIDLFEEQAERTPFATAVAFADELLSYQHLNERANQLAHYLAAKGISQETLVPVYIERSLQMIVAVLGILKAGAAYVPLDPDYPAERIQYMLNDTNCSTVVTSARCKPNLAASPHIDVIELDHEFSVLQQQPVTNREQHVNAGQLAYIIYTSGSTGKPKGVMIEHGGLVNLSLCQAEDFRLQPGTSTLQFASFGFDASCSEIFTTLLSGGCLVLPQKKDLLSAEDFEKLVNRHQVEVVTLPPSYQLVIKDSLGTIRTIISAGEPLNETTGRYLQSKGIRLINAYGPTENTVCVTMSDDPIKSNRVITIGKPISNVKVYITDKDGRLCPTGIAGEICVSGVQVARGYLNRPELTAEKFVPNPFQNDDGARMYKTGDLGRWLPDGNIEYLGRFDDQVKIRGYRIELGEIENALHLCPGVGQAVVLAKNDNDGNKRLVAYVIDGTTAFDRKVAIAFLKKSLPDYMVPSAWVKMPVFPLTSNGKIDKKALPEPETSEALHTYTAPRTEAEQKLVQIWQKLFGIKQLGIHDNFFDLGGNSILAIQIVTHARRAGYHLQPADFFNHQTIEDIANVVTKRAEAEIKNGSPELMDDNAQTIIPFNREGTKTPFFFMSPGFSVYDKVVQALDKEHPFYFFVPYPYKTVEEIAAFYIHEMKRIQPEGPYCLGGYCGFGEVALEMAQQLAANGEKVTFLALFEFYYPSAIQPIDYRQRLVYYCDQLLRISVKEKVELCQQFIQRKLRKLKRRTNNVIDRRFRNLPETTGYLIGKNLYWAKPYKGKVLLFRSESRTARISDDPFMGWRGYFTGGIQQYTITGDHKTMFEEPGATSIAKKIMENVDD